MRAWEMLVYFIRAGTTNMVKIGLTANIDKRLVLLQSGHYETLKVLRVINNCDWRTERWLHEKYNHICVRGEWFDYHRDMLSITPTQEELATIKRKTPGMINGIGKPGRPMLGDHKLTNTERSRRWRAKLKAQKTASTSLKRAFL